MKWRMLEEKLEGKKWKEVEILWLTEDGEEVVAAAEGREGTYCPSLDFGRREMYCSCLGFRTHGTVCKHLAALLMALRGRRREEELEGVLKWRRTPGE